MSLSSKMREAILAEIEPLLEAMGFTMVELAVMPGRGGRRISIVVNRPQGIGIDECAAIARTLGPRLQLVPEIGEVSLEVSSPGLDRILKSPREYEIFRGRGIRLLTVDRSEWLFGVLEGLREGKVVLNQGGARREIDLAEIKRARLEEAADEAPDGTGNAGGSTVDRHHAVE